jgi:hypothetical protein
MKIHLKFIRNLLLLPGIILGMSGIVSCGQQASEPSYQPFDPSEVRESGAVQGIRGAIEYYSSVRGDESGDVDQYDVYQALLHIQRNMPAAKTEDQTTWTEMGPTNIGGRTRALAIDIDDPRRLYAGAVSGGFWISTNQGGSWQKYQGELDNLAINCMEQTADGTIFFGTGEQNFTRVADGFGNSGVVGMGIWRSTDRGETFEHLEETAPQPGRAPGENFPWNNVNMIKSDPENPDIIFAGNDGGLFISEDAGDTWTRDLSLPTGWMASDIRVSPSGETVFVVAHRQDMLVGHLYRSTERGELGSFERVGATDLSTSVSRMIIAIAPSNPNYVYASTARSSSPRTHGLEGVYRSTDNGENWERIASGGKTFDPMRNHGLDQGQGDYDNIIAVDPYNENRIFLGGVHYYSWTPETNWLKIAGLFRAQQDARYFVHADKHEIIFDTTQDPYIKYITTDGGITHSRDAQNKTFPTYAELNRGYATVQFYAFAGSHTGDIIGGTQDNGTIILSNTGPEGRHGRFLRGGDGAQTEISVINPNVFFFQSQYGSLVRSFDRGENMAFFFDNNFHTSDPVERACGRDRCPFVTPIRLWEQLEDTVILDDDGQPFDTTFIAEGNNIFYLGAIGEIWAVPDAISPGADPTWFRIAQIGNLYPHYIETAPDGNTIFVAGGLGQASSQGRVIRITGIQDADFSDGSTFDPEAEGIEVEEILTIFGQRATGLAIDPNDHNRLLVTLGNYGNDDYIYYSENVMAEDPEDIVFTSVHGNMPRMPVYDAIFNAQDPDHVILATEFGAFATDQLNGNNTIWYEDNNGMVRVPSYMIRRVHDFDRANNEMANTFRVFIATHGRGIFGSDDYSVNPITVGMEDFAEKEKKFEFSVYPNPADNKATIDFEVRREGNTQITLYDLRGQVVLTESLENLLPGDHEITIETGELSEGLYLVNLQSGDVSATKKLMIRR